MRKSLKEFKRRGCLLGLLRTRTGLAICFMPILAGCNLGPVNESPEIEMPCEWHNELSEGMQPDSPDCFIWWESLNDPLLNSLIERASCQNLDIYIAAIRILQAREEQKGGSSGFYPHLDGSAAYGGVQFNQKTLDKIIGKGFDDHHNKKFSFFEAGFDAEWEIDLFGMTTHQVKALQAKYQSMIENFRDVWITLSAEIAKNYIELRGLQLRLKIINQTIESQKDTLKVTEGLIYSGFTNSVSERQAAEQLSSLSAQVPQIELSIKKSIHRLSILLGQSPGELFAELSEPAGIPSIPFQKPVGIPSELLRRRPDIQKAEKDFAAAVEQVQSAIAALFPRITLRGFIGDIGLLGTNSPTYFGSSELLLPIFNSKLLKQDVTMNKLRAREAAFEYQKTVLNALEEVENALASFHAEMERSHHLEQALKASFDSNNQTMQLYQNGFKDYLEVLLTNRSYLTAQEAHLQSQIELLLQYVALYKALGGGWEVTDCGNVCSDNDLDILEE